jgi:hypothetical protein
VEVPREEGPKKQVTFLFNKNTVVKGRDLFEETETEVDISQGKHLLWCRENNGNIDGRLVIKSPNEPPNDKPLLFFFQMKYTEIGRDVRPEEVKQFCKKVEAMGNSLPNYRVIPVFITNRPCSESIVYGFILADNCL